MAHRTLRTIVVIGPPGAGKETIGRAIGQLPGYYFSSVGEALRSVDPDSDRGREINKYVRTGDLVPEPLALETWRSAMEHAIAMQRFAPEEDLLILDGLPRTVHQASEIEADLQIEAVFAFQCGNEEELTRRILGRHAEREDDARRNVIAHRFTVYREQTEPLLKHYPNDLQVEIDAGAPPLEVLAQVVDNLRERDLIVTKLAAVPAMEEPPEG